MANSRLTALTAITTCASGDFFYVVDVSDTTDNAAGSSRKVTFGNINSVLAHDTLSGVVANQHIDHSGVDITAGAGLTGGGTITATRTLTVGAGTGIAVNANDVALSHLGIESLTDPDADRILFWDDSAGAVKFLAAGTNLTITDTTIAATDTNTTYTAGDGLDLSGTAFSVDLKSNGGVVIESTEMAVDLGASSLTGTLAVGDGGTGATSLTDGGILLGSGGSAITAMTALADGSIVVGDGAGDPVALAAFTSSTGTLKHESGGLEANVSAYAGLVAISGGATSQVDTKAELEGQLTDVSDFAEADGDVYTGVHDFGGASSLEIPNSATPTVDATGEIALDTSITDYDPAIRFYDGGNAQRVVSMRDADFTTTDNNVIVYDAAGDRFKMEAQAGGGASTKDVQTFTGRLTGQSANYISTTDQTLLGTIYLCGPTGSTFRTFLWDGAEYDEFAPSQLSLSFSGATSLVPHDVYLYDNGGTATLEKLAWSSATTRATALAIDALGVIHKNGDRTRRYVGTVYCYSTGMFTDSTYSRHIWNLYNQKPRALHCPMTGSSWTYSSNTIRASNSNTTLNNMRCDWVQGLSDAEVNFVFRQMVGKSGVGWGWNGIGIDSTSSDSAQVNASVYLSSANTFGTVQAEYRGYPGIGYHYGQCLENSPGMVSIYFYGTDGSNNSGGMIGTLWC